MILTSEEINSLLQKDTELFSRALNRGKEYLWGRRQKEWEQA
ncbi:hypothetical protein [Bacillus sp. ISL-7]|nr:hypothetical protein [Bacillus sp. ISL-7]